MPIGLCPWHFARALLTLDIPCLCGLRQVTIAVGGQALPWELSKEMLWKLLWVPCRLPATPTRSPSTGFLPPQC